MNIKKIENENSHNKIDKSSSFEKRATLLKGIFLGLSVVAVVIGLQIIYATQWIGPPTGALPGTQNIAAPINVGTITQTKQGGLNIMGDVGIGTATPAAKLHIAGTPGVDGIMFPDGSKQTSAAVGGGLVRCQPTGFEYETICSTPRLAGDAGCPIWKDCDGDGITYGGGDCDENCAGCFIGSTYGMAPDGRDQNCNGAVDEYVTRVAPTDPLWGGTKLAITQSNAHQLCLCRGFDGVYTWAASQHGNVRVRTLFADCTLSAGGPLWRWIASISCYHTGYY